MIHTSQKQPIIFFGASYFVLPIIEMLQKEYDLQLVLTTELSPIDAVPTYCTQHNIPFISVSSVKELLNTKYKILNTKSPLAVLAYFGLIVPQSLIDLFPKGIVNIHPSRLPLYRGPTPGQTALVLGDVKTGVSIMLLDKEVDHGPILAQEEEIITSTDTSVTLYERLFAKGVHLLKAVLPAYISEKLQPIGQNHSKATFTKSLTRESGFIDIQKPISGELLDRMIRAYYPWPGAWTFLRLNASEEQAKKEVRIKFLPGKVLQVEGKKPMNYKDFINGYEEGKAFLQKLHLL